MTWVTVLAVAIGGALGAICRFGLSELVSDRLDGAHWGVFIANILGCLLIGVARAAVDQLDWGSETARFFLFTGFIGSFTTFSTFESDIVTLWNSGGRLTAFLYGSGSVFGGLLAYLVGWWIFTKFFA